MLKQLHVLWLAGMAVGCEHCKTTLASLLGERLFCGMRRLVQSAKSFRWRQNVCQQLRVLQESIRLILKYAVSAVVAKL